MFSLDKSIHFVMQSKGGVGKSVVASMLSQYLLETLNEQEVHTIDLDPNNKTLSSYKALKTEQINIIKDDENTIDQSKFDGFLQKFLIGNKTYVVDTGSGEYLELNNYLSLMSITDLISQFDKTMCIHVPVVYGQAESDTKWCLAKLAQTYPDAKIIIWENEFFTKATSDIKKLDAFNVFDNIIGVVSMPKLNTDTFEKDFKDMIRAGRTFNEVQGGVEFGLFSKTRLKRIKENLYSNLDDVFDSYASLTKGKTPVTDTKAKKD